MICLSVVFSVFGGRSFSLSSVTESEEQEMTSQSSLHSEVHFLTFVYIKHDTTDWIKFCCYKGNALVFLRRFGCGGQRTEPIRVPGLVTGWWNCSVFPATSAWVQPERSSYVRTHFPSVYFRQSTLNLFTDSTRCIGHLLHWILIIT